MPSLYCQSIFAMNQPSSYPCHLGRTIVLVLQCSSLNASLIMGPRLLSMIGVDENDYAYGETVEHQLNDPVDVVWFHKLTLQPGWRV